MSSQELAPDAGAVIEERSRTEPAALRLLRRPARKGGSAPGPPPAPPWVSPRVLGRHAFCPRAALLEQEAEESGEGDRSRSQRWQERAAPPVSPAGLRRATRSTLRLLVSLAGAAGAALAAGWAGVASGVALPAGGLLGIAALLAFARLAQLGWIHTCARVAPPQVPDAAAPEEQAVHWWALLRGGFEVERPARDLSDTAARLRGRPWRILRRGELRIPVARHPEGSPVGVAERVELAAWGHLIERAEGGRSPYGIALSGRGPHGTAVPLDAEAARLLRHALAGTFGLLSPPGTGSRRREPKPPSPEHCLDCELGRPEPGTRYSLCGARFRWRPPHAVTRKSHP